MILLFLAEGFEETEALGTTDILRRAGINVKTAGVGGKEITGSHGITVTADYSIDSLPDEPIEGTILPGGIPGTPNLDKKERVRELVGYTYNNGLLTAAICAGPSVLGHMGILEGRRATCYPGFETELEGAEYTGEPVTVSGHVITGNGAGSVFLFGGEIVSYILGKEKADEVLKGMQYKK